MPFPFPDALLPSALRANEVVRFAPSPTGPLHLGHAFSALYVAAIAQKTSGTFLLRIEDTDGTRSRREWEAAIHDDMAKLGLSYPKPLRQSERLSVYAAALETLKARGLLYPCFCTRADIRREYAAIASAPHGPDGPLYPGICKGMGALEINKRIADGEVPSWRMDCEKAATTLPRLTAHAHTSTGLEQIKIDPTMAGDVVLARKDIGTSYHLACVVDDAAQGITLVTRGEDMAGAMHVQRSLQALLNLPETQYAHHKLVRDDTGRRLAKRSGDMGLSDMLAKGLSGQEILDHALARLG